MTQFEKLYAEYFDLINSKREYGRETHYIDALIKKHFPLADTILNINCKTGSHADFFYDKGFTCHGIDEHPETINSANKKRKGREDRLFYSQEDIANFKADKKFDVVIALFHTMSYQISNSDVITLFENVKKHLDKGGLFLFDFLYGPSFLTNLPKKSSSKFDNGEFKLTQSSKPTFHPRENLVDFNYKINLRDLKNKETISHEESHTMRYFFDTELELICQQAGFEILDRYEWRNGRTPDFDSEYVFWILENK